MDVIILTEDMKNRFLMPDDITQIISMNPDIDADELWLSYWHHYEAEYTNRPHGSILHINLCSLLLRNSFMCDTSTNPTDALWLRTHHVINIEETPDHDASVPDQVAGFDTDSFFA